MPSEPSATTAPPVAEGARGRRPRPGGPFALAGAILAVFLMASTAPSPMYAIYQREWHFSSTVLTVVFAVYMVGILAALLLFGSLSDHLGRRPVLLGSIALEAISLLVLAFAPGVRWLCAGRVLQGLATGAVTSAVSATLLDFQPRGSGRGPLVNGVAAAGGMAVGSVLAGALVQFAPFPTELSYLVLIAALVVLFLGVLVMPEPVTGRRDELKRILRPQRPTVPEGRGRTFALLATTMLSAWTIGGMFMSLGPSVASGLVGSNPHFVGGLTVAVLAGVGSVAQVLASGWHGKRAVRLAVPLLLAGLAAVAVAVVVGSAALLFAGSVVLGAGWGLMFAGGFRMLSALAAPEQRAGTSAMIYVIAYLSAGGSSILLGYLTTLFGLNNATIVFAVAAGAFAVLAGIGTGRQRS